MSDSNTAARSRDFLLSPVGYFRAMVANARLIVGGTVVAAIAGAIAVFLLPAQFSSSASLLVSPPPFKDLQTIGPMMPRTLAVPDYQILLTSDGILMRAAKKVADKGDWSQQELDDLQRISVLQKIMKLEAEVAQKTVNSTIYSPIIVLTATANTAEHSRELVEAWAEVSQEVSREAYQKSKSGLLDVVKSHFDDTKDSVREVASKIRDEEIAWNDELARAQLTKTHSRFLEYKEKIIDQKMKTASTEKEIADIEANLESEPEHVTLYKSPPMTAVFMEDVKKGAKDSPQGYIDEELNAVHVELKNKLNAKRGDLINLQEYTSQMESQLADVQAELQSEREENATKAFDRKLLNLEETTQMRSYDLLSGLFEQAKFVESDKLMQGDIKLISEAVLPDKKSWPPRTLFILLAAFSGMFVSTALVLLRQAVVFQDPPRA